MVKITPPQIPTTTQKFPSQQNFPSPQWADMPGLPTSVENMGGLESIHGRDWGGGEGKNAVENYLWSILYVSKVASYKPAKACKFTKNELFHTYFSRILARF